MKYLVTTLPADPSARGARLAFERAQNGHVYQRADGSVVLVRTSWPFPSPALVDLVSVPADWTEITS